MLKLKLQYFGHLMRRVDSLEKTDAGRDWGQEEKGTTEDEMAGWHHWLNGHESGWTPGVGDGQGGLACCDSWGRKESDTTEWSDLNSFRERGLQRKKNARIMGNMWVMKASKRSTRNALFSLFLLSSKCWFIFSTQPQRCILCDVIPRPPSSFCGLVFTK